MHRPTDPRSTDMRPADKTTIFCLTFVALASSLFFGAARIAWLPAWTDAAVSFGALLWMLLLFRRRGGLRSRFVVLFVAALAAAALYGWLFAAHV